MTCSYFNESRYIHIPWKSSFSVSHKWDDSFLWKPLWSCVWVKPLVYHDTCVEVQGKPWCSVVLYLSLVWDRASLPPTAEFTRSTPTIFSSNIHSLCSNLLSIFQLKQVFAVERFSLFLRMEKFSLGYFLKKPQGLSLCIRTERIHLFTFWSGRGPWCLLMLVSSHSISLAQVNPHCLLLPAWCHFFSNSPSQNSPSSSSSTDAPVYLLHSSLRCQLKPCLFRVNLCKLQHKVRSCCTWDLIFTDVVRSWKLSFHWEFP